MKNKNIPILPPLSKVYVKKINGKWNSVFYLHSDWIPSKINLADDAETLKGGFSTDSSFAKYQKSRGLFTQSYNGSKKEVLWTNIFTEIIQDSTLKFEEANEIARISDLLLRQLLRNNGYCADSYYPGYGTEIYLFKKGDQLIFKEIFKEYVTQCVSIAYLNVTGKYLKEYIAPNAFMAKEHQEEEVILPTINAHKNGHKVINNRIHQGSGKTPMSIRVSELMCKEIIGGAWKTFIESNTIANTLQSLNKWAKQYEGQTGKRCNKLYFIGSATGNEYDAVEYGIKVVSKSDELRMNEVLEDCMKDEDCCIAIVRDSSEGFSEFINERGISLESFYRTIDESQDMVSETEPTHIDSPKCAMLNPKYKHLWGYTSIWSGTPVDRENNIDKNTGLSSTDKNVIYNDDIEYCGIRPVNIDEQRARELGWVCETQCFLVSIPSTDEWIKSLRERRPIQLTIGNESILIQVDAYATILTAKLAIEAGKTHILIPVGLKKAITSDKEEGIIDVIKKMQKVGDFPQCTLIAADAKKLVADVARFNKAEKAIIVSTRCIATGQDTYNCDCLIPGYEPKSAKQRAQTNGRKDRNPYDGKVSWFMLAAIEGYHEDSYWNPYIESMSNGEDCVVTSEIQLIKQPKTNPAGGKTNHPKNGRVLGNVNVVKLKGSNPILFLRTVDCAQHIASKIFTDDDGNSRYSEIVRNYNIKQLDEFKYLKELFDEDRKIKRTRSYFENNYSLIELDKIYCEKFPNDYGRLPNDVKKLIKISQPDKNSNREMDLVYSQKLKYLIEKNNYSYDYLKTLVYA